MHLLHWHREQCTRGVTFREPNLAPFILRSKFLGYGTTKRRHFAEWLRQQVMKGPTGSLVCRLKVNVRPRWSRVRLGMTRAAGLGVNRASPWAYLVSGALTPARRDQPFPSLASWEVDE